jgi:hypothetical protein
VTALEALLCHLEEQLRTYFPVTVRYEAPCPECGETASWQASETTERTITCPACDLRFCGTTPAAKPQN